MKKTTIKPNILIGIPAYNEEANIGELLKHILSQRQINFNISKIIVISDGSTDKTVAIVSKFKNKKITLINYKKRKGQISRQNEIIKMMAKNDEFLLLFEADTL